MTKRYVRPMPKTWWLRRFVYTKFMLREITSVFIALFLIELLCFVSQLPKGPEAMHEFLQTLQSPGWILFHGVALAFALFHTITWFNLTPKVMVVRLGEEKLPAWLLAGANYVAWIVLSALLVWLLQEVL